MTTNSIAPADLPVIGTRRPWPSKEEVTAHYRARARADDQIGQYLSAAWQKPDLHHTVRTAIAFWMEFHPECDYRY